MSRLDDIQSKLTGYWEQFRESEFYQQLKTKYDELDPETKLYINLGALAGVALLVVISVLSGISSVNSLKSQINDREEAIGFLERSSDTIKRLKASQEGKKSLLDASAPLSELVESVQHNSGFDQVKMDIGKDMPGAETKDSRESLLDVKMTQTNLRQITHFLFELTMAGESRNLIVRDLKIDTQNDPSGYMDASFTLASYSAK